MDEARIRKEENHRATLPLAIWQRSARRAALVEANKRAEKRIREEKAAADGTLASRQAELDSKWEQFVGGDPEAVRDASAGALAKARLGNLGVTVDGNVARVIARTGSLEELVPADMTDVTPGGKPTVKRRSKTDRNLLFGGVVISQAAAVVKTVFAAAPSVERVEVVVVERTFGLTPLFAVGMNRDAAARATWHAEASRVVLDFGDVFDMETGGRTSEMKPIFMHALPELRQVLDDFSERHQVPVLNS